MDNISIWVGPHQTMAGFQSASETTRGVYLVYRINDIDKRLRLIYIGSSEELADRVSESHELYSEWLSWAGNDKNRLRFSWVILRDHDAEIKRCRDALINALQPPMNQKNGYDFNYEDTTLVLSGRQICGRSVIEALKIS